MGANADAPTLYQGVERDGFGMKMLANMGWREGRGLGKHQHGIAKHVHAKKRASGVGVGADARSDASGKTTSDWTMNTVAFDDVLRALHVAHDVENSKAKETPECEAKATKDVGREGDERRKKAKKASASDVGRSAVGHAGRYRKRESQKMVQNYSATDMEAILGTGFVVVPEVRGANGERDASGETSDGGEGETKGKAKSREKKIKAVAIERPRWVFDAPKEDWWGWRVGFRPEGHGGANGADAEALERKRGFDEDDQTKLFEDTHAGANKNRHGLGAGVGRAADADFVGVKKSFDDDDEVDESERAAAAAANAVKWQKIGEKILSKYDGSMKTKKFVSKLLDKSECGADENIRAVYRDAMFHILSRSGAFTSLEEAVVKLATKKA